LTRRVRVRVSGAVQGVFFREATRRAALRHDVSGWVRNTSDGSVEAVFEGDATGVERMIDFCRVGPPSARVDDVDIAEEQPEGLAEFTVR
jgi:acylphosphatase